MRQRHQTFLSLLFLALLFAPCSRADAPVWTKRGVSFLASCFSDQTERCRGLRIFSPDRSNHIDVSYHRLNFDNGGYAMVASAKLVRHDRSTADVGLPGQTDHEIEWSLDSNAFLVNGSDAGVGPEYVVVYLVADADLHPYDVSAEAQKDLVRSIPPCHAKDLSERDCKAITENPEDSNIFGVDFTRNSSAVIVLASYICSSSQGGIMCQSIGYEVDIKTGDILRRMQPREFKTLWQHSLAWKYEDPGPPEYKDKK